MFAPHRSSRKIRSGFTLIELLIVITVIGILVGLLFPAINVVRRSVYETTTAVDIAQLDANVESFRREFGFFPSDFSEFVDVDGNPLEFFDPLPNVAPFNGQTVQNRLLQMLAKISPSHNENAMDDPNQTSKTRLQIWWEDVGMNLAVDSTLVGTNKQNSLRGPQVALWFWLSQLFNDAQYPLTGPRDPANYYLIAAGTEQRMFHDFGSSKLEVIDEIAYPDSSAVAAGPNLYSIARPVQRDGDAPLLYFHHATYVDASSATANTTTFIDFEQGNYDPGDPANFGMACRVPGSSIMPTDPAEFLAAGEFQILTAGYDEMFGNIEDGAVYENGDNLCNFSEGRLDVFIDDFNSN